MRKTVITLLCSGLCALSTPALAQTASSSAYALGVDQAVTAPRVATATVTVGPLAATSGNAPPSYNQTNTVASVNQSAVLTGGIGGISERIQTGVLTSTSSGTATSSTASATVNNLSTGVGLTILDDPALAGIFRLGATTIQSTSSASSVGGLSASGNTTIEGLLLGGSALETLNFNAALFANPAANTVLFNFAGLSIILNEQVLSGDGINGLGITTNAIRVGFNNFVTGTGLVNGNIIIGQSRANVTNNVSAAVPEPATWAMMLIGFGAIGLSMRRRQRFLPALSAA